MYIYKLCMPFDRDVVVHIMNENTFLKIIFTKLLWTIHIYNI